MFSFALAPLDMEPPRYTALQKTLYPELDPAVTPLPTGTAHCATLTPHPLPRRAGCCLLGVRQGRERSMEFVELASNVSLLPFRSLWPNIDRCCALIGRIRTCAGLLQPSLRRQMPSFCALSILVRFVSDKTFLYRLGFNPKDKFNHLDLSHGTLRVHYNGTNTVARRGV